MKFSTSAAIAARRTDPRCIRRSRRYASTPVIVLTEMCCTALIASKRGKSVMAQNTTSSTKTLLICSLCGGISRCRRR